MEKLLQRILKETRKGSVALTRDKSLPLLLRELLHINLQEVSERQYPGQKSDSYFSGSSIQLVLRQIKANTPRAINQRPIPEASKNEAAEAKEQVHGPTVLSTAFAKKCFLVSQLSEWFEN